MVVAVAAFGGLILGVFNARRDFLQDKIRLRISLRLDGYLYVDIANLSAFSIVLAEIGFSLGDGFLSLPAIGELRTELRPRRATHFALTTEDLRSLADRSHGKPWQSFYTKTQCGTTVSERLQPDLARFLLMLGDPQSLPAQS